MSAVIGNPLLLGPEGYQISRSVRLRSSASAYFNRTLTTPTNNKIWTWSSWVKRGTLGAAQVLLSSDVGTSNSTWLEFGFDSADTFTITSYATDSNTTSAVFRDPSAWYHIVIAFDSTQATTANRCKIYVNGVQQTLTGSGFTLNAGYGINSAQAHAIGQRNWASGVGRYFDGYLTEINFIDGQALTPSSFGENDSITGVWKPKKYAGTYGTNGFYLNFSDNSNNTAATIGKDYSGNGNNWTPNNISVTSGVTYDSMLDVPTPYADGGNGRGNYCTINPLDAPTNGSFTISDGNLRTESTSSANRNHVRASIGVASGKWYWEITVVSGDRCQAGVALNSSNKNEYVGYDASGWGIYQFDGNKYNNQGGTSGTAYGSAWTTAGDVLMVALDATNSKLWFGKNGTWFASGDPVAGTNAAFTNVTGGELMPAIGDGSGSGVYAAACNFGQRPFAYTPPSGFVALNTQNLPDSTIKRGGSYFNSVLYTGNAGNQSITGVGFQPDLVWGKLRSTSGNHRLHDSLRGSDNTLSSNLTDAEVSGNGLVSFDADGFTMDSGTNINQAYTYVAWNWKAGNSSSSNTSGSITSTVSVNATAGFSVVTYTGTGANATVGHGLGVAPKMVIVKCRNAAATSWAVYHANQNATPQNGALLLESTAAYAVSSAYWNNTAPTSSLFTVGTGSAVNTNTNTYVAYCWAAVAGYSAFGSYTGNGSTDGPFVFLGFRPRFIMTKRTDSTSDWHILDTSRNTYNVAGSALFPNSSSSETTNGWYDRDFLSNGFKIRASVTEVNASGGTYIYAAFAENPFKNALAR